MRGSVAPARSHAKCCRNKDTKFQSSRRDVAKMKAGKMTGRFTVRRCVSNLHPLWSARALRSSTEAKAHTRPAVIQKYGEEDQDKNVLLSSGNTRQTHRWKKQKILVSTGVELLVVMIMR